MRTSTTKREVARSCSSCAFSRISRAICASRGSDRGRPGAAAAPVVAAAPGVRRQSTMWLE